MLISDSDVLQNPINALKQVKEIINVFEASIKKLQEIADENTGKVQKITPCNEMCRLYPSISSYETAGLGGYCSSRSVEETCAEAMKEADKKLAESKAIHEANIPLIELNKKLRERITTIMKNAGIPDSYQTSSYKSSRSRSPTTEMHHAGWISDLNRYAILDDGWNTEQTRYNDFKRNVEDYRRIKIAEREKKKQEEETELKKQEGLKKLGAFLAKYNLPASDDWSNVLEAILSKNKYLRLAYFLSLNRGDWSDGCDYAERGIAKFKIESEEDRAIDKEIRLLIANWDGDGRVFRDCRWNYSVLFEKVSSQDPTLYADYIAAQPYQEM